MHESEIQDLLARTRGILEQHKVKQWADTFANLDEDWLRACQMNNTQAKRDTLDKINALFGGMGSFSDLFINQVAGDDILPRDESSVNEELRRLRSRLYTVSHEEAQDLDRR